MIEKSILLSSLGSFESNLQKGALETHGYRLRIAYFAISAEVWTNPPQPTTFSTSWARCSGRKRERSKIRIVEREYKNIERCSIIISVWRTEQKKYEKELSGTKFTWR